MKVGDEFIQAPDEVVEYHTELLKSLNKRYATLEKNILDQSYKIAEEKELRRIDKMRRDIANNY